jgi:hypothetical protein
MKRRIGVMEIGLNGEISPESTSGKNKDESASFIHEPGNNCKLGLEGAVGGVLPAQALAAS